MKIKKEFMCGKTCAAVFRNKCCIVCLVLLFLLLCTIVAVKLFVDSLLHEIESESFNTTFKGLREDDVRHEWHDGDATNLMDTLEFPRDIAEEFPHTFSGYDYNNQPVWIVPFGKWDVRKVLLAHEDNDKRMKYYTELGVQRVIETIKYKNASKLVIIGDMDGYSYSQLASYKNIAFQLQVVLKYQPLFDILDYGYLINMDYFSRILLGIVTPLVGSLLPRLSIIGTDKEEYIGAILAKIPASQLPPAYGGTDDYKPIRIFN